MPQNSGFADCGVIRAMHQRLVVNLKNSQVLAAAVVQVGNKYSRDNKAYLGFL